MAETALISLIKVISSILAKGETVSLVGFGTFQIDERAPRKRRNHTAKDLGVTGSKVRVQMENESPLVS